MNGPCIIIPAIKKSAKIPDQLVRKLDGITLIQRAINTALEISDGAAIYVITDSQEICLICERNGVNFRYDAGLNIQSTQILQDLRPELQDLAKQYTYMVVYRASTPLVGAAEIEKAYQKFLNAKADLLVTLRHENHRLWKTSENRTFESLIFDEGKEKIYVESRSFLILNATAFLENKANPVILPEMLGDEAIEIDSYQNWWICEKLLQRKRIVFVVKGFAEIGMGHIFRALTLAHEIHDHEIHFLCTRESELAVKNIAEREYPTHLQQGKLLDDVLALQPDLVVNDILTTDTDYISGLQQRGVKVVNFEDIGEATQFTNLTFNEIYDEPVIEGNHIYWGNAYYFLRDEFNDAQVREWVDPVKNVLITFGGTDPQNFTGKVLQLLLETCKTHSIGIYVVAGPGYQHKVALKAMIEQCNYDKIRFEDTTPVMSRIMEQCDIAVSSNGRTVFELAHMKIPAIILSQHERENEHSFASASNGFLRVGLWEGEATETKILQLFHSLIQGSETRETLYNRMQKHDFSKNKQKVAEMILNLLR